MFDDDRQQERAAQAKRQKQADAEFRRAFQSVMALPDARLVLNAFLRDANVDGTAYRDQPVPMAHAVGWQDAGKWWLAATRQHCPEREAQMRNEARERDKRETSDDDE